MAGADPSIYFQQQTPDFIGNISRGLSMRDMMDKRSERRAEKKKQKGIEAAYQSGIMEDDQGNTYVDKEVTMASLGKVDPMEAMKFSKQYDADQRAKTVQAREDDMYKTDMIARVAPSMKDQASYEQGLQLLQSKGIDTSEMPQGFDQGLVNRYAAASMSAMDQFNQRMKLRDADRADQALALKREEAGFKRQEKADKAKTLSTTQAKQRGLFELGIKANNQYNSAVSMGDENKKGLDFDPTSTGQMIDNSEWAPNWMKNDRAIEAQAAQSAWVEAFLRDASGAAIPPSERGAYAVDFFPQPGDSKQVVQNKAELREQKMKNALIGSGMSEEEANQRIAGQSGQGGGMNNEFDGQGPKRFKTNEIDWK